MVIDPSVSKWGRTKIPVHLLTEGEKIFRNLNINTGRDALCNKHCDETVDAQQCTIYSGISCHGNVMSCLLLNY